MPTSMRSSRHGISLLSVIILLVIVLAVLAMIILPDLSRDGRRPRHVSCQLNLRQISCGLLMYASDNDAVLPVYSGPTGEWIRPEDDPEEASAVGSFGALFKHGYLDSYHVFVCPVTDNERARGETPEARAANFTAETLDYCYVAGLTAETPGDAAAELPAAFDDVGEVHRRLPDLTCGEESNHGTDGINVLYLDGHVEFEEATKATRHDAQGSLTDLGRKLVPPEGADWRVRWE